MATVNTFVPIVGSLDAPFAIVNDDGFAIPRDPTEGFQSDPRPGVLRWVLILSTPDATGDGDDVFRITVPFPEDFDLPADILSNGFNAVLPSYSLVATSAGVADSFGSGVQFSGVDVDNRTLTVDVSISSVAQSGGWTLTIDFCHSAVN